MTVSYINLKAVAEGIREIDRLGLGFTGRIAHSKELGHKKSIVIFFVKFSCRHNDWTTLTNLKSRKNTLCMSCTKKLNAKNMGISGVRDKPREKEYYQKQIKNKTTVLSVKLVKRGDKPRKRIVTRAYVLMKCECGKRFERRVDVDKKTNWKPVCMSCGQTRHTYGEEYAAIASLNYRLKKEIKNDEK